jgi:uncharacterized damage-inducible protein DinB
MLSGGAPNCKTHSMTWIAPTPELIADGPLVGPHQPLLEAFLEWHRYTLLHICEGLTGEQLASHPIPSSNLSLLGLIRHMAKVERIWFRERVDGQSMTSMYAAELGKDADFNDLDPDRADADYNRYLEEVRLADATARVHDLEDTFELRGDTFSLRWVYFHMIAEYARHNGHADLLREAIDGEHGR